MMDIFRIIILLFLIHCSNIKCIESNDRKSIFNNVNQDIEYNIELQKVQFEHLKYYQNNNFKIINNKSISNDIFINFLSINCNINIKIKNNENDRNNIILLNNTEDSYSFLIKKEIASLDNTTFQVNPLMDIINGKYKYDYELRNCPLVINSGEYKEGNQINIENKEPTIFYFNDYLRQYNILYNVKSIDMNETFVTFYFIFDRKSKFEINILDNENNNISASIIENSTNIFLDYNKIKNNSNLNISIYYIENNYPIVLKFKIIENNTTSILQNNYLNYGFITSRTSYQYYYMEVFKGEEGEIILHNKIANGHLYAFIIQKKNKDNEDIENYNDNYYPNNNDTNYLELNGNTLKLKYNFSHTNGCEEGCYLLLTYYHEPFLSNDIIGYEFTLLVKVWDDIDMSQQIVNIPFNEYIFGYFEEESINEHYYSIFLPNDTKELIVQIEGKNFDGFIGAGKKKLITSRKMENIDKLIITNKQMVFRYQIKDLSYINIYGNKYMSFAFRPIDYFADIFSYYSFRIFYLKEGENLIIPLDSNIGSICRPTKDNDSSNFYCYFLLKNINNLFSLSYSISTANINKNINLYYLKKYDNTYHKNYTLEYRKVQNFWFDEENNVDFIIFKYEFNDNQIQKIMLTFFDQKAEFYPHIYSSQMHQLKAIKKYDIIPKTFKFSLPKTFSFIITFIHGAGAVEFEENEMDTVYLTSNLKGQPFFYSLFDVNNLKIFPLKRKFINFICKTELINIIKNNGVRELTVGEPMNEIIINKQIPFFYYIKYNKNIVINFRLINNGEIISPSGNETTNFDIEGYILEYKYIEKKLKGEYIELKKPIKGYYDLVAKTGLFQINEENNENEEYLLIKIDAIKGTNNYIDSNLIIQTVSMYLDNNSYILPINQYIAGRFNNDEDKNYLIQVSEWEKMDLKDYLIEFSANYEDLIIEISEDSNITFINETGIKKYLISKVDEDIKIKVKNPNKRPNSNYIIRYFSTTQGDEYNYTLIKTHKTFKMEVNSDDTVNFKFEFENIKIRKKGNIIQRNDVYFEIYSSLFVEGKIDNNEKLETIATLSSKASFSDKIITKYMVDNDFNISFKNITREFYKYNLQIKIHVLLKDSFLNEDYLVYSIPIDLTNYLKSNEKLYIVYILIALVVIIIIIIIIFCIIYKKLKKQNLDLKDKVLSISFSSGMTKDVLEDENEGRKSKKDEDYETTFI
jgi:hypothetical protein